MLDILRDKWEEIKEKLKEDHDITNVSYKTWIQPMPVSYTHLDVYKRQCPAPTTTTS